MRNLIGVMQGRLLPKYQGRYQAHPVHYWQEEFFIARKLGLDCIEFILDFNDIESSPLLSPKGIIEIKKIITDTGVKVRSICADYFMHAPIHSEDPITAQTSQSILEKLILLTGDIGVKDIVIPCVDQSSLNTDHKVKLFVKNLSPMIEIAEKHEINLSLETDLSPMPFLDLLNHFNSNFVSVNYDIGNSASLGYNPREELEIYGDRISDIHIKDRKLGGGPVILGEGDADFNTFFDCLKKIKYKGPFIMQAYRDEEGVKVFERQLNWILRYLDKL